MHHVHMHGFYLMERAYTSIDGSGGIAEAGKIGPVRIKVPGEAVNLEVFAQCMRRPQAGYQYLYGDSVLKHRVKLKSGGTF